MAPTVTATGVTVLIVNIEELVVLCHLRGNLDALICCSSEAENHFCNTAQLEA